MVQAVNVCTACDFDGKKFLTKEVYDADVSGNLKSYEAKWCKDPDTASKKSDDDSSNTNDSSSGVNVNYFQCGAGRMNILEESLCLFNSVENIEDCSTTLV